MKAFAAVVTAAILVASAAWAPETSAQAQAPKAPATGAPAAPAAPATPAPSMAKEIEGKVKSVDVAKKTILLEDGTALMVKDAAELKDVKPGSMIKASYSEQGGQKVATSVDVKN